MNYFVKIFSVIGVAVSLCYFRYCQVSDIPAIEDKWWGPENSVEETHIINKTKIDIPADVLTDLYYRLNHTKSFHPSLQGVNQTYGIHTTVLDNILEYWKFKYNWTARQNHLNKYWHHFVNIRGLKIHFLHVKPKNTINHAGNKLIVLPLLLLHGWPSSFTEFYELIPRLTEPRKETDFVFELVIPSLPGFAFSESSKKPGLSPVYMAQIFADLMKVLNYEQFYIYGGDWGSVVAKHIATQFSKKTLGVHSTTCFSNSLWSNSKFLIGKYFPSLIYDEVEKEIYNSTGNSLKFLIEETGYFHLQATKPDTIGVALTDSPIGLAAYIFEKLITLTDANYRHREDGGLLEKFTMDQLLDNIMIYWCTGSITSSMRIYAEVFANIELELTCSSKIEVPAGCLRFRHEVLLSPRFILKDRYKNLVHLTTYDRGGHFAALEEPELLANDIFAFVEKVEVTRVNY